MIDRSLGQMTDIATADHVICDSAVNLAVLRQAGIMTPATIIPLIINTTQMPPKSKPSFTDGIVRIIFIGRFVSSKGPTEMLQSVYNALSSDAKLQIQINMVGNLDFSDPKIVQEVKELGQQLETKYPERVVFRLHASATNDLKFELLRDADIFVLPTYHEGFCVPILEAFSNGCLVITYENSNTPFISGGLATLVPTGNIHFLSEKLRDILVQVRSAQWRHSEYNATAARMQTHLAQFSPNHVSRQFMNVITQILAGKTPAVNPDEAVSEAQNPPAQDLDHAP